MLVVAGAFEGWGGGIEKTKMKTLWTLFDLPS